jgi:predicted phosphodiesterase
MQLIGWAYMVASACWSHADIHDEHLLVHFAVGTQPIVEGRWNDLTGRVQARVEGRPKVVPAGTSESLVFSGNEKLVMEPVSGSMPSLRDRFSVSAWVSVEEPVTNGVVVGCFSQKGEANRGWRLGYEAGQWVFGLATAGSSVTNASWAKVVSRTPILSSRWYYVVGSYDGLVLRLYVNGLLTAESSEAAGEVLEAAGSEWVIGGDGTDLLRGGLLEVKVWDRVVAPAEVTLVAARNRNLIDAEPAAANELSFLVEPILQFGTKESMTFVCETSKPTKVEVHYGMNALLGKKVASEQASLITELTVGGLETHKEYFYRVDATDETGKAIRTGLRSFQTAPPADQPWAFGVIGDTQRNPEITRRCAEGIFACRPNFMLHCGDVVDDGFAKNQWLKDLFEPCKELMAYVPTFPVIGNHEKDSHWYYDYFALPKPEHRYTFEYGNAEFFMVDTNRPLKPGSEQYQWLEKELSESKATWKIAAHHHPCFSSDDDDYGDHLRGRPLGGFGFGHPNAKHAIKLYEKYGVDVVFNGHIHVYERTWPIFEMAVNLKKGIRYITSGGGGGGLENPSPQRTWFSLHVNKAYHYCHVAVFDRTMVFKAYDVDGRLFDSFEMTKGEDR